MPTEIPLPVATIFSLRRMGKDAPTSDVEPPDPSSSVALGAATPDAVDVELDRSLPAPESVEGIIGSSLGGRIISETGRRRVVRGIGICVEEGFEEVPRRRNLFAFSRGPASFLNTRRSRRVALGSCSEASFARIRVTHTGRRRVPPERKKVEFCGRDSIEGFRSWTMCSRGLPDPTESCWGGDGESPSSLKQEANENILGGNSLLRNRGTRG